MTAQRLSSALLALVLVVVAAAPRPALATQAEDVVATARLWVDAFNRKSAPDIVALYAADAVFFGTSSPLLRDSPAKVADYFASLPTLGDATITLGEHRVQLFGDVAILSGYYTRSFVQGGQLTQNPARFTFVYAKRAGRWQIVNHHSSALP